LTKNSSTDSFVTDDLFPTHFLNASVIQSQGVDGRVAVEEAVFDE
jgi:hypothetical protein